MRKLPWTIAVIGLIVVTNSHGCSDDSDNDRGDASNELVTSALEISGSLENGVDASNKTILANQSVQVIRNDGVRVGTATTNSTGEFKVEVAAGGLAIDSGFALTDQSTKDSVDSQEDYKFYLQAAIGDDGTGKAIGVRRRIDLSTAAQVSEKDGTGQFELGTNSLKEISAITGTVAFSDSTVAVASVDVFIPGKSFFARTGDDGSFQLLFVPPGDYHVRIQKGLFTKDVDVTVKAEKTSKLGSVTVGHLERDPLPLVNVIEGTWTETCYFKGDASSSDAANPSTGTVTFGAATDGVIDDFSVDDGFSCLIDNVKPAPAITQAFIVPSDAVIIRKFDSAGTIYGFNHVTSYTNNRITIQLALDTGTADAGSALTVLERQ